MTRRALLSVWDKSGLVEFGTRLHTLGFELVASGGTARKLRSADLPVIDVSEVTGHPEILGGRVKTLHPAVHGGLLARGTDAHLAELAAHGIAPIDLVVCNLYPFLEATSDPSCDLGTALENIDIGGPTMIRAAAKAHPWVTVVVEPSDYDDVVTSLDAGGGATSPELRARLARKAFAHTARYDAAISAWLEANADEPRVIAPAAQYFYKPLAWDGSKMAVLAMNSNSATELSFKVSDVPGLKGTKFHVRDVWNHADLPSITDEWKGTVGEHDCAFLVLTAQ